MVYVIYVLLTLISMIKDMFATNKTAMMFIFHLPKGVMTQNIDVFVFDSKNDDSNVC